MKKEKSAALMKKEKAEQQEEEAGFGNIDETARATFKHPGSFGGCGGNPTNGSSWRGNRGGNCSSGCSECGARTHWQCCGSSDKKSTHCLLGISKMQATQNVEVCTKRSNRSWEAPRHLVVWRSGPL
jgi:hypothetical protein